MVFRLDITFLRFFAKVAFNLAFFKLNCIQLTIETTCGDVKHSNIATSVALSCTITSCFRVADGRNNILFVISVCTYNFATGINFCENFFYFLRRRLLVDLGKNRKN